MPDVPSVTSLTSARRIVIGARNMSLIPRALHLVLPDLLAVAA